MVSGKDHENDRLAVYPDHSGVIGDEGLAVSGLVGDADIPQILWKPVIDLLLFHDAQDQIAGFFGDQLA